MKTYDVTFTVSVEASSIEDAEELVIELIETDPAIEEWRIVRQETAV